MSEFDLCGNDWGCSNVCHFQVMIHSGEQMIGGFEIGKVHCMDCLEGMRSMPDNSIDTIITDPPYGLRFMGKAWDYDIPSVEIWAEALRVAKPGAILLAFGGTRTFHRIACSIEDAGWEIRDTIMWIYGSGFPKSLNIGKAIDKMQGNEREVVGKYQLPDVADGNRKKDWDCKAVSDKSNFGASGQNIITKGTSEFEGYGTALKPAFEPIIVAMKPLDGTYAENALKWGVAGLNIDGCRVGTEERQNLQAGFIRRGRTDEEVFSVVDKNKPEDLPGKVQGRFPANLIHDGSDEVLACFPDGAKAKSERRGKKGGSGFGYFDDEKTANMEGVWPADNGGSAARFFYCAKASTAERNAGLDDMPDKLFGQSGGAQQALKKGESEYLKDHIGLNKIKSVKNNHPTVKPLKLMEYLCDLTKTPTGGIVLDPFSGSGTTGMACKKAEGNF